MESYDKTKNILSEFCRIDIGQRNAIILAGKNLRHYYITVVSW